MVEKRLKSSAVAYYWSPPGRDFKAGFSLTAEALGQDYAGAIERAAVLNRHLDDWRTGRGKERAPDLQPSFGTLNWLVARYRDSKSFQRVSPRVRPDYLYVLDLVLQMPRKSGALVGEARLSQIDAVAVDKLYERLQTGSRGKQLRIATMSIMRFAKAWDEVRRLYPRDVPSDNPFRGVVLQHGQQSARPATRAQAWDLHNALIAAGEPHLAVVPLVCFEWHQRPENVVLGSLTWADWRPPERPDAVRVLHAKTDVEVWQALSDDEGPLFPELEAYLDALPRLGVPIVLRPQKRRGRGPDGRLGSAMAVPYTLRDARARVRKAARGAGLPDWLTLAACRHGGLTELGDAGATEAETMASSGHKTPDAARLYVKRTDAQRLAAARKRRALRANKTGT